MPLNVAILWHMHQPYYVDPLRGAALMPWVRLHATKGYLDMVWLAEQFPELHCTFNLTPVLLQQIEELARGQVRDLWQELAATPAAALTAEQKTSLLEHFFKANVDNMVRPQPRYWSLLQKRGVRVGEVVWERAAGNFHEQDYRDLQVWFNLAWFGYAAERLYPELAELKRKGRDFTEEDKRTVLELQQSVLRNVVGYYRALADRGQIEISTTPFFHPILPLVHNTDHARRCQPEATLPPAFAHPEDVRAQLARAREYHRKLFGRAPHGVWPSEGSVCPELIPILQELGFEWFATDEEILWCSTGDRPDRDSLFQGYRVQHDDASVCAAFRDRTLSDFVGFNAARNDPQRAADFMIQHLENIAARLPDGEPLCAVILDGENAWENFPDGGEAFLREFYRQLTGHPALRSTTFHDYFTAHPPHAKISTLHTGSWINANFRIWVGHPEDNRAWELLGHTRDFVQRLADRGEITTAQHQRAMNEIYAAEGSDWFWWYGDDFVTDNDLLFDELFRTHLQNVYNILGAPVPKALEAPICRSEAVHETHQPTALITPQIDGLVTSFYEWAGAGVYEARRSMGAMHRAEWLVNAIHFGGDLENFSFRLDVLGEPKDWPEDVTVQISFLQPKSQTFVLPRVTPGALRTELRDGGGPPPAIGTGEAPVACFDRILELAISYQMLGWRSRDEVLFSVQLLRKGVELERHPTVGALSFTVPDEQFEVENWRV